MSIDPQRAPPVTIGLPVFNGAAFLAESLECLRLQTFNDFEVLIFDNASTDETSRIAADYAARDPRFRHVRQPENVGALRNFKDVLAVARSPFFMWRAADDLSDLNYVETLYGLLQTHPDKTLAVGRVVTMFNGAEVKEFRLPPLRGDGGLRDQHALMFDGHPAWIYGLFRTEALQSVVNRVIGRYGENPRAWDNLSLMPFMLDSALVGSDQTAFRFTRRDAPIRPGEKRPPYVEPPFDVVMALRRRFIAIGREFISERFSPGYPRLAGGVLLWLYANKNTCKLKHLIRRSVRGWIGLRP